MDTARQTIPMAPTSIVTAEQVIIEFHGDVPASVRFFCPSCDRPVRFNRGNQMYASPSEGAQERSARLLPTRTRASTRRTLRAHFKHARNDAIAKLCDRYQAGIGTDTRTLPPSLPMFLRRDRDRHDMPRGSGAASSIATFHLELAVRRRSLGHDLVAELRADNARLVVDRVCHDLADLVANRRHVIRVQDLSFQLGARICVPEQWQRHVGVPEDGDRAFVFTAEFGPNGGRRLAAGSSLHAGFDYYVLVRPRELHTLQECFDVAETVGVVPSSHGDLQVVRIVTLWKSGNRGQAEYWLADHGFRLTSLDLDPLAVWPPQLRFDGVDEPLFRESFQIYQTPFAPRDEAPLPDTIDFPSFTCSMPRPRRAGFVGFGQIRRSYAQVEGECCFLRADRHLPWSAFLLSRKCPEGLELADPPDLRASDPPRADVSTMAPVPTLQQVQRQRANRQYDVTQMRAGRPTYHGLPSSMTIARIRSAQRYDHE